MDEKKVAVLENEKMALHPVISSASTARIYSADAFGELDLGDCAVVILKQAAEVAKGNLASLEEMLLGQAVALNAMFAEFARKAAVTQRATNAELYIRTALKAQAQSRATLQTLAEIKNPRPVAFVKQQNIAHGHQQVNNGESPSPAHAGEFKSGQNELLEGNHGERLDTGTPGEAIDADPAMATVEKIDGAAHG
ncbi:hypothetical protein [Dechloromonas sp. A34]|uniref:hypothetical protein n=1 Tax=Dechloromonas sp. A34 TaxID=447588 RepID=UPI0022496051|nr:hypothetical protein [Dechloromonas sp. A34]